MLTGYCSWRGLKYEYNQPRATWGKYKQNSIFRIQKILKFLNNLLGTVHFIYSWNPGKNKQNFLIIGEFSRWGTCIVRSHNALWWHGYCLIVVKVIDVFVGNLWLQITEDMTQWLKWQRFIGSRQLTSIWLLSTLAGFSFGGLMCPCSHFSRRVCQQKIKGSSFIDASIKSLLMCYWSALGQSPVSTSIRMDMGIGFLNWLKPFKAYPWSKGGILLSNIKEMDEGHQSSAKSSVIGNELFHIGMGKCLQSPQLLILGASRMKGTAFYYRLIRKMALSPIEKPTCLVH